LALDNNLTHFPTDIAMYRNNKYCLLYTSDTLIKYVAHNIALHNLNLFL